MREYRFFDPDYAPEWTTPEWYADRERAPHLEEPEQAPRLHLAAAMVGDAVDRWDYRTLSDMGAGDGGLLSLVEHRFASNWPSSCWGYDLQPSNVWAARQDRGVKVNQRDVLSDPIAWGEIAVCTEMLEHLVDPHRFVKAIPSDTVVASSPLCETPDEHYEFHLWGWDGPAYGRLFVDAGYEIVRHESPDLASQVLLAHR